MARGRMVSRSPMDAAVPPTPVVVIVHARTEEEAFARSNDAIDYELDRRGGRWTMLNWYVARAKQWTGRTQGQS